MNLDKIDLESLGYGAAAEFFDRELTAVCENIKDENTDAKATREVTLKVKIKPSKDRESAQVEIHASSKLAPVKAFETNMFIYNDRNQFKAFHQPKQKPLIKDIPENVRAINSDLED